MGTDSKAVLKPRTPDASRDLGVQRVSRQRVECGASAPLSKGVQSERLQYSGLTPLEENCLLRTYAPKLNGSAALPSAMMVRTFGLPNLTPRT
jgi:hypothetical protein